jgi:N-acetyl-anhydromuramyl-L-alanine amidase AmpD
MFQWIKRLFGSKSAASPAPASPNLLSASTMSFTVEPRLTSFDERKVYTPNKGSKVIIPSAVVLHHSDGSYRGGVAWISNPASKVSYHVLIARDGRRTVFCNDTERAWHAGKSNWQGRSDLNSWSLGVAWEGNTYEYPLGNAAIDSALEYLLPRLKKWNISRDMVLDHRLVSPGRKTDLAPAQYNKFQERLWAALAAN